MPGEGGGEGRAGGGAARAVFAVAVAVTSTAPKSPNPRNHGMVTPSPSACARQIVAALPIRNKLPTNPFRARSSLGVDVSGQEVEHSTGEDVVAVAGHHMSGSADIGEFDLRETREELVGAVLADQVAHLAADQQDGHPAAQDRLDGGVHPIGVGHLKWRE